MNSRPDQDLERSSKQLDPNNPEHRDFPPMKPAQKLFLVSQFTKWYNGLSQGGKIVVIGAAFLFGVAILQAVLKLVAAVFSLTILGLLLYFAYRFFSTRSIKTKD